MWDLATGKLVHQFTDGGPRISSVAFSPDGQTLAAAGATIHLYDLATKKSRLHIPQKATLNAHEEGILAYYDYPISTAPLEGTNTIIQAMKRQAYGFRDDEFFKLKILGIHETKHAFVG